MSSTNNIGNDHHDTNNIVGGAGGSGPCGACRFLRRKCVNGGCIFAPYFGSDQLGTAHFAAVHKVFGASNASKILMRIPPHKRLDAVVSLCYEALSRVSDPVYGCVSHIFTLQQQGSGYGEVDFMGSPLLHQYCGDTWQHVTHVSTVLVKKWTSHEVHFRGASDYCNFLAVVNLQAELAYTQARLSILRRPPLPQSPSPTDLQSSSELRASDASNMSVHFDPSQSEQTSFEMGSFCNSTHEELKDDDLQRLARELVAKYLPGIRTPPSN